MAVNAKLTLTLAIVLLIGGAAGAQTDVTWTDGSQTDLWNEVDSNWSTGLWINDSVNPDNAVFGPVEVGDVIVSAPIIAGDVRFEAPGYSLRVQEDLTLKGRMIPGANSPDLFLQQGMLLLQGPQGALGSGSSFVGMNTSQDLGFARIRLDNSQGVNNNRISDTMPLDFRVSEILLKLTESPRVGDEAVYEQAGTVQVGGLGAIALYKAEPAEDEPVNGLYYYPENQTTLEIAGIDRSSGQGVLLIAGHGFSVVESSHHYNSLGELHRVVVAGDKPQLIEGKIVEPYMVDPTGRQFLTYDSSSDAVGEIGFKTFIGSKWFLPDGNQENEVVYTQDSISIINPKPVNTLVKDTTVLAIRVQDPIYGPDYDLRVTSGGVILGNVSGFGTDGLVVESNIVSGTETTPRELFLHANVTSSIFGSIKAPGMTVAGKPGVNSNVNLNLYGDNQELTGPIGLFQCNRDRTRLFHANALGIGNDITIGAGTLYLKVPGEVYRFGNVSIGTGKIDVGSARFETTLDGQAVKDWICSGKITSVGHAVASPTIPSTEDLGDFNTGTRRIGWVENGGIVRAGYTWAGDSNVDGDVDNADIAKTFSNFTGSTGTDMEWGFGDYNYDGDVDNADIATVFQHYTGAATAGLGENPDVLYDYMTGEVKIASDGATVKAFQLEIAKESLAKYLPENVDWTQLEAIQEALIDLGLTPVTNPEITDLVLGWSSDSLPLSGDAVVSVGRILPVGLSETELNDLFSVENTWGGTGSTGGTLDLQVVPEPATMCLLSLGWVGLLRRRRK